MTNQTTTSRPLHHRQPRNFLSSSASNTLLTSKQKVAFDAYRNQPFDEEQATITYVSNKKFYICLIVQFFFQPHIGWYFDQSG